MQDPPQLIEQYLHAMMDKSRHPAWLAVDREGLLIEWGGATSDYGLRDLARGHTAVMVAEFLDGLLPLQGNPEVLPAVQTVAHGCADIHLIPGEDRDWVLLLDATAEVERRQIMQQQVNELALLREREAREQEKSDRLLASLFPASVSERLRADPFSNIAEEHPAVTILFADLTNFWRIAGTRKPTQVIDLLNRVFSLFDGLLASPGVEKVKTIDSTYMAVAGLQAANTDHAAVIADLALSMQREISAIETDSRELLNIRIGIHSGPVIAGVIGIRKLAYDLWGPTVAMARQMESCGVPGGIQVSAATYGMLKDDYLFEPRGEFYVPDEGAVSTYLLTGRSLRPRG